MSIGVYRPDWRPQLPPAAMGPLLPAGGGIVVPNGAAAHLQDAAFARPPWFWRNLSQQILPPAVVVAAAVPASSLAYAPGAKADFTAQEFEIGSELAALISLPPPSVFVPAAPILSSLTARYDVAAQEFEIGSDLASIVSTPPPSVIVPLAPMLSPAAVKYDATAQAFEIGSDFASIDGDLTIVVGTDWRGLNYSRLQAPATIQPSVQIGALIGNNPPSAYLAPARMPGIAAPKVDLTAQQFEVVYDYAPLLPVVAPSAFIPPNPVLGPIFTRVDFTAQEFEASFEYAAVMTFVPSAPYIAPNATLGLFLARADFTAQAFETSFEYAAVLTSPPATPYLPPALIPAIVKTPDNLIAQEFTAIDEIAAILSTPVQYVFLGSYVQAHGAIFPALARYTAAIAPQIGAILYVPPIPFVPAAPTRQPWFPPRAQFWTQLRDIATLLYVVPTTPIERDKFRASREQMRFIGQKDDVLFIASGERKKFGLS